MSELYCVEVPEAPERELRFATFHGNQYSGFQSISFVPLNKVIYKGRRTGVLECAKGLSWCQRMVDDLRQAVCEGWSQKWLASARVVKYLSATNSFEVVYSGPDSQQVSIEPEVPKAMLAFDGTWRYVPTTGFSKGAREWGFSLAHVDSRTNVPYADRINGATKLETITKVFESQVPWIQDYVLTLPLANPADIPPPPEPSVEYVPTQAELDAVQPLSQAEWAAMPAEEHKRRYVFDPLYREAYRKMLSIEKQQQAKAAEKKAKENEEAEIQKLKKQFIRKDEDDLRKSGGR